MAEKLKNGKWNPVVWDNGLVNMTKLVDNKFVLVECDTKKEAEAEEKRYREFWK